MKKLLIILIIIVIFNKIFFNVEKFSDPNNCNSKITKQQFYQSVNNLKSFIDSKNAFNPTWFGTYSNGNFDTILDNDCNFYYNIENIENGSVSSSDVKELKTKFNNLIFCTGDSNVNFWPCHYYGIEQQKKQNNNDFDNIIKFKENIENNLIGLCKLDEFNKLKNAKESMDKIGKNYGGMFNFIFTKRKKLCENNLITDELLTDIGLKACPAKTSEVDDFIPSVLKKVSCAGIDTTTPAGKKECENRKSSYGATTAALSNRKMMCMCNKECTAKSWQYYKNCTSQGVCDDHQSGCTN